MALPITAFTVNDGATPTPVAQTFNGVNRDGMASTFRNAVSSLVRGAQIFAHEVRLAKTPNAANRVLISLQTPVEGTVDGQVTVLRSSLFKLEANFSPNAPETERVTHYYEFLNALAHADIKLSVPKLQSLT